jgi:hypothetical protein
LHLELQCISYALAIAFVSMSKTNKIDGYKYCNETATLGTCKRFHNMLY